MKLFALTTAVALGLAAPALANDQLARSLGVEPGVLTTAQLTEIKATADNSDDNRAAKALIERYTSGGVTSTASVDASGASDQFAASFGIDGGLSASQIATIVGLTDNDDDNRAREGFIERINNGGNGGVVSTMSTGISAGHQQLAAQLGLEASEYSVAELVAIKGSYDSTDPRN
jgi:hypothetical protein